MPKIIYVQNSYTCYIVAFLLKKIIMLSRNGKVAFHGTHLGLTKKGNQGEWCLFFCPNIQGIRGKNRQHTTLNMHDICLEVLTVLLNVFATQTRQPKIKVWINFLKDWYHFEVPIEMTPYWPVYWPIIGHLSIIGRHFFNGTIISLYHSDCWRYQVL